MDNKFQTFSAGDMTDLYRVPYLGMRHLYDISSVDLAKAVPFISIVEVDVNTNEQIGVPIEYEIIKPPSFGQSVERFGERANVSLESVSVKQEYGAGWWIFSRVDIAMVVHRPDYLSSKDNVVSNLITPGKTFMLTYGWQGGDNPIIGDGYEADAASKKISGDDIGSKKPTNSRVKYPSLMRIRFNVTTYNFDVRPNGEIGLTINAVEDFELNVRNTPFLEQIGTKDQEYKNKRDLLVARLKSISKNKLVKVLDLLNVFAAEPLSQCYRDAGYSDVTLQLGNFNAECPEDSRGNVLAEKSIGEYQLSLDEINVTLERLFKQGRGLTVRGFIQELVISKINTAASWKKPQQRSVAVPDLSFLTLPDPKSGSIVVALIDKKAFLKEISKHLSHATVQDEKDLPKKIDEAKLPVLSIGKANGFMQNAKFEVMLDDQVRSLMTYQDIKRTREQIVQHKDRQVSEQTMQPGLLMNRSAIRGSISMIGNFVFNTFGMMWVDFGVKEWNGVFKIIERNDKISREGFITNLTLMTEGINPLAVPQKTITPADQRNEKPKPAKKKAVKRKPKK